MQTLTICATMYIIITYYPRHGTVVYNCSIAEISPDIPLSVKEQCRNNNAKQIKGISGTGQSQ